MPELLLDEYLEIGGIPLSTPAFTVVDLSQLYDDADVKGEDYDIPHANGVISLPRRIALSKREVPMVIFGDADVEGEVATDQRAQLIANIAYLRANVTALVTSGDGTREAILHLAGGVEATQRVKVIPPMQLGAISAGNQKAVLDLEFPYGMFDITP